ncbi:response regulator transcription factor [Clostridium sp. WLY-B-L2]|uniref:Stage 0 sporulation protein A homolog n=2 Tax=Clostridiaceae TaxID=31979 RepID=A0ABS8N6F4_9CLOT|nr:MULTISPECIES: response regulator transcription factor [Clostridium]MCC9295384.1 response regulator transcription factor [Clostridium aromativorans]
MNMKKALIVDDEVNITELIKVNLEDRFQVKCCYNGLDAVKIAEEELPNIIILDIMLPGIDGFEVCRRIRKNPVTSKIPIIMLTVRKEENDKIVGLKLGGDDYITKPFSVNELLARIDAVLRRVPENDIKNRNIIKIGNIIIDNDKYEVTKNGRKIEFTLREFKLLQMLAKNRGNIVSRDMIIKEVWGCSKLNDSRTLDVHIRKLRKKLEDNDKFPEYIETVRGLGYMIK